jgi:hypothetical protein
MAAIVEDIQAGLGTWVLAYGRHMASGDRLFREGDKVAQGLGVGVWDALEKVWYKGAEVAGADYTFHPGTLSTGFADPVQGSDPRFTSGTQTYSGLAWLSVNTTPTGGSPSEDSREIVTLSRCRIVPNWTYDEETGAVVFLTDSFSANPARIAADVILNVQKLPATRIDWGNFTAFRDWCNVSLTVIEDGVEVTRPRAEIHPFWTQPQTLAAMLDWICVGCFAKWLDDGTKFRFFWPGDGRAPVLTLRQADQRQSGDPISRFYGPDWRQRPNLLYAEARDPYDATLRSWRTFADRGDLIDAYGPVPAQELQIYPVPINQLQRLADFALAQQADRGDFVEVTIGPEGALLLPGDLIEVADPDYELSDATFEVVEAPEPAPEDGWERKLKLRSWVETYSDSPRYQDSLATHPRPLNLQGTILGNTSIQLQWETVGNPENVEVWRNGRQVATVARPGGGWSTNPTYTDTSRASCTTAVYRLRAAYLDGGRSAFSNPCEAVTLGCAVGQTPTPQEN